MKRKNQWILIDNFKRKIFLKKEIKYKILKSFYNNNNFFLLYNYLFFFLKIKFNFYFLKIQQNKRCLYQGRIKSTINFLKMSRFFFRLNSYKGELPGFKRLSW